jgi:hypothetical protein
MIVQLERRTSERHPVRLEMTARELPAVELSNHTNGFFEAHTENIGQGGLCLVADKEISLSSLVFCQIRVSEASVMLPAVMTVQWVQRIPRGGFRFGLRHLISVADENHETP